MSAYRIAVRSFAAATLLCCSFGTSTAADLRASHIASGVGQWIAAQGNAALQEMREELRRDLNRQLKPLLPEPPTPAPAQLPAQ